MRSQRLMLSLVLVAALILAAFPAQAQTMYPEGTVSIELTSVGAGIGASWGKGVFRYGGKTYQFKASGISIGSVGISTISAVGNVYNIKNASDLAGTYAAAGAGLTLAGGIGGSTMRNQRGVIINLYTTQSGVQLNIGPEGFTIEMLR